MDLTLDSLKEAGAFTGAPVEKEIKWEMNGQEHAATVYVRRLSYDSAISDIMALRNNGDAVAGRIASCILGPDGKGGLKPIFTPGDITGLTPDGTPIKVKDAEGNEVERGPLNAELTLALLQVIGEVNSLGKPVS